MKWLERTFLICNAAALAFLSLYVPWYYRNPLGRYYRLGYSWQWKPPEPMAAPDLSATALQIGAYVIISASVFLVITRWKRRY